MTKLDGIVPRTLAVKASKIVLDRLEVMADIGFHEFEIGSPQRLLVTVEIWLDAMEPPAGDDPAGACDYDLVRDEVIRLASARRYNLQETLARSIYDRVAALAGVGALRVATSKPDVYTDAHGVGVEIASFAGNHP